MYRPKKCSLLAICLTLIPLLLVAFAAPCVEAADPSPIVDTYSDLSPQEAAKAIAFDATRQGREATYRDYLDDSARWDKVADEQRRYRLVEQEPEIKQIRQLAEQLAKRHGVQFGDGKDDQFGPQSTAAVLDNLTDKLAIKLTAYDRTGEADAIKGVPVSFARPGYVCDTSGCRPVSSAPAAACSSCSSSGPARKVLGRLRGVQPVRRVLQFLLR